MSQAKETGHVAQGRAPFVHAIHLPSKRASDGRKVWDIHLSANSSRYSTGMRLTGTIPVDHVRPHDCSCRATVPSRSSGPRNNLGDWFHWALIRSLKRPPCFALKSNRGFNASKNNRNLHPGELNASPHCLGPIHELINPPFPESPPLTLSRHWWAPPLGKQRRLPTRSAADMMSPSGARRDLNSPGFKESGFARFLRCHC